MSSLDPRTEPLRRALTDLAEVRGSGEDCPDAETLWRSASEELAPDEDSSVIRHIGECSACGVAWELARELAPVEEQPARRGSWRTGWGALAAAAVVVLAVTGTLLWLPGEEPPVTPAYRDAAANWLVSELPETSTLPREDLVLRWSPGPEGTTYDVVVTDEGLRPVTTASGLTEPALRLEPDDLAAIAPDGRILWRVTAHLAGGESVSSMTFINMLE